MHPIVRFFVALFVVLALPVQGMASLTMAHCGQGHERMQATPAEASHPLGTRTTTPDGGAPEDDGHAGHTGHTGHQADGESGAIDHQPAQPDDRGDPGTCSSCASCCAGSALPSVMPRIPDLAPAPTVFVVDLVDIDAFATDGPDRPPRRLLA